MRIGNEPADRHDALHSDRYRGVSAEAVHCGAVAGYGPGMRMQRRRWSDLSRRQQGLTVAAGAIELALTTVSLVDIARRPAAEVRGPKGLWVLAFLVQPVGPIGYLMKGRRRVQGRDR